MSPRKKKQHARSCPRYFHHIIFPDRKEDGSHPEVPKRRTIKFPFPVGISSRDISCRQTMGIRSGHSKYVFINITENTGKMDFRVRRGQQRKRDSPFLQNLCISYLHGTYGSNFRNQRKFCRISCGKMGDYTGPALKRNSTFAFFSVP